MRQVRRVHKCPKRERQQGGLERALHFIGVGVEDAEDTWNELNGERMCSFCGSLHPQDFMYFLSSVLDTRSSYWIYVNQRRGEICLCGPGRDGAPNRAQRVVLSHLKNVIEEGDIGLLDKALEISRTKYERQHVNLSVDTTLS